MEISSTQMQSSLKYGFNKLYFNDLRSHYNEQTK